MGAVVGGCITQQPLAPFTWLSPACCQLSCSHLEASVDDESRYRYEWPAGQCWLLLLLPLWRGCQAREGSTNALQGEHG